MLNIDPLVSLLDVSSPRSLNCPAVSGDRCLHANPPVCVAGRLFLFSVAVSPGSVNGNGRPETSTFTTLVSLYHFSNKL